MPLKHIPDNYNVFSTYNLETTSPITGLKIIKEVLLAAQHSPQKRNLCPKEIGTFINSIDNFTEKPNLESASKLHDAFIEYNVANVEIRKRDGANATTTKEIITDLNNANTLLQNCYIDKYLKNIKVYFDNESLPIKNRLHQKVRDNAVAELQSTDYKNHILAYLNQDAHPLIRSIHGMCHGIALKSVYDILSADQFFNQAIGDLTPEFKSTDTSINPEDLALLEKYQGSQEEFLNILKSKPDKETPTIIKFEPSKHMSGYTAQPAAKEVAGALSEILDNIPENHPYGFLFGLDPNNSDGNGHILSVAVKDNVYYFIDANLGLFKFGDKEELLSFVQWHLFKFRYCHDFAYYEFSNFPQMEHEFPTPTALKKMAQEKAQPKRKSSYFKPYHWLKDRMNDAYTIAALTANTTISPPESSAPSTSTAVTPASDNSQEATSKDISKKKRKK